MLTESNCSIRNCVHYQGVIQDESSAGGFDEKTERHVCNAFPVLGIPNSISYGNNLHIKSQHGDNGIVYQEKK